MSDQVEAWASISHLLRAQLNESVWFSTFSDVTPINDPASSNVVIAVPNSLNRERIMTRYLGLITDAMSDLGMSDRRFDVVIVSPADEPIADRATLPVEARSAPGPIPAPSSIPTTEALDDAGLNHNYRFDTFVKGASNQFALAAALRVAETPARSYNPLFIYGSAGLGKTHLLHAIGHYVHENYHHHVVRSVSTETFMNEYVDAIRSNSMAGLRRRYREIDVLLIDDVQFLENKEGLQEEFFHTCLLYTSDAADDLYTV